MCGWIKGNLKESCACHAATNGPFSDDAMSAAGIKLSNDALTDDTTTRDNPSRMTFLKRRGATTLRASKTPPDLLVDDIPLTGRGSVESQPQRMEVFDMPLGKWTSRNRSTFVLW